MGISTDNQRMLWLRTVVTIFVAGIVGIALIVLSIMHTPADIWNKLFEGVGVGLLVSCVVGITIEQYSRQLMRSETDRMLTEIRTDVFKASLGVHFPESIWIQVWKHLISKPILRKNIRLDYKIENIPEYPDYLLIKVCWSYKLCNLNLVDHYKYPFVAALDIPGLEILRSRTSLSSIVVDNTPIPNGNLNCVSTDAELICKTEIDIGPEEEKEIVIRGQTCISKDAVFPHSMVDPSEDFQIDITMPPEIGVLVYPLHPRDERLRAIPTASDKDHKCWRIDGGILPGHGIVMKLYVVNKLK